MTILTSSDVLSELSDIHQITCLDPQYGVLGSDYLAKKLFPFWKDWLFDLGIQYVQDNWDCDKFARAFQSQVHIACFEAKAKVTALCGFMALDTPTGGHAINLVKTELGWLEVEPQNCTITRLRDDKSTIRYVIF